MVSLKSVERAVKAATTRAVAASLRDAGQAAPPDWSGGEHRVLFLRHDRIGDMILSTGILRAIAAASPRIRLDVLASPVNAPVLSAESYVHDVVVFDRHRPLTYPAAAARLRARRYDAVVDCMITAPSTTTLLLMLASGARHRIGVRHGNDFAYTLPLAPRANAPHIVDKLGALAAGFGLVPDQLDLRPRITLTDAELAFGARAWRAGDDTPSDSAVRLLVNVSAGKAFRHWPDDHFLRVISRARARARVDVRIIAAPSEWSRAGRIAALSDSVAVQTPSVRDAFAIVAASDVVFTPDTSIAHAASAFARPATVLYVQGMSMLWGPYGTAGRALESPTHDLEPISADDAVSALEPLLDAARRP